MNTLTASIYTATADPCFLRASLCRPPWEVLPLSFACSAFLAACHSPTNKEEECDTTSRNTNGVTLSMSRPPLLSNVYSFFPLCGYLLSIIFCSFLCIKSVKHLDLLCWYPSQLLTPTQIIGGSRKPSQIVPKEDHIQSVIPHSFYHLIGFCDCVSPSFSRRHRPHHSAVVLRLHLQARGPSQHPPLRQGRDGEVLPGRDN